jgi:hypothetical protein|tara:strand:- start:1357 stop:1584 length:228 start_codon:yes stop_codon:yes gene_type:complete
MPSDEINRQANAMLEQIIGGLPIQDVSARVKEFKGNLRGEKARLLPSSIQQYIYSWIRPLQSISHQATGPAEILK